MKTFNFDHEPTFAELWDACGYNLLYVSEEYKKDLENLFDKLRMTKESKIIDTSAGGGFPGIELIKDGYNVTCVDGFDDQVELFSLKAKKQGLMNTCIKALWKDLPTMFPNDSFDFLFCRGNSFIYAGGAWNSMIKIDANESIKNYKETLAIFYNLLKPGGKIYIDKFKDDETTHREKVCEIKIGEGESENLVFWTQRFPEQKIREASMIRETAQGEKKVPGITYDLSAAELESFLTETGFQNIQKINVPSEKHFDVWIAQK